MEMHTEIYLEERSMTADFVVVPLVAAAQLALLASHPGVERRGFRLLVSLQLATKLSFE